MIQIKNNGNITINQGDHVSTPLFINMGTQEWPIRFSLLYDKDAKILFSIMTEDQDFFSGFFRKMFSIEDINDLGDVVITLTQNETRTMPIGLYFYQIKLAFSDGEINTITDRLRFQVR